MPGIGYRHVAVYVEELRRAEEFYGRAFAADVRFREAVDDDGVWRTLPPGAGWQDADRAGVAVAMTLLQRDEFFLPVFAGRSERRIVGLHASREEIRAMRGRLPGEASVLTESEGQLVFADPFQIEWQVTVPTPFRSSGELYGRWLDV